MSTGCGESRGECLEITGAGRNGLTQHRFSASFSSIGCERTDYGVGTYLCARYFGSNNLTQLKKSISLASFIKSSPTVHKLVKPVANAYAHIAGYRQMGLRYDDLIQEENMQMQKVRILGFLPRASPAWVVYGQKANAWYRLSHVSLRMRHTTASTVCGVPFNALLCSVIFPRNSGQRLKMYVSSLVIY